MDTLTWVFNYLYHLDKANACLHCAPVKFSPLTFRLLNDLIDVWPGEFTAEMVEVRSHVGQYELDLGR